MQITVSTTRHCQKKPTQELTQLSLIFRTRCADGRHRASVARVTGRTGWCGRYPCRTCVDTWRLGAAVLGACLACRRERHRRPRHLSARQGEARPDRLRPDDDGRHQARAVHVRGRLGRPQLPAQAGHHPGQESTTRSSQVTGFWQGMSGSPLYIDDKLVCAFSYGFRFNKVALGGCTPIDYMKKEGLDTPRRGDGRPRARRRGPKIVQPAGRDDGDWQPARADRSIRRPRSTRSAPRARAGCCRRRCPRRSPSRSRPTAGAMTASVPLVGRRVLGAGVRAAREAVRRLERRAGARRRRVAVDARPRRWPDRSSRWAARSRSS